MAITSSTIDITALRVAGEGATNYITDITSNGIFVHSKDSNTLANGSGVHIGANEINIIKEGVSNIKAWVTDTIPYIRIGREDKGNVLIDDDSVDIRDATTKLASFSGTSVDIGQEDSKHISVDADGITIHKDDSVTLATFKTGTGSATQAYKSLNLVGDAGATFEITALIDAQAGSNIQVRLEKYTSTGSSSAIDITVKKGTTYSLAGTVSYDGNLTFTNLNSYRLGIKYIYYYIAPTDRVQLVLGHPEQTSNYNAPLLIGEAGDVPSLIFTWDGHIYTSGGTADSHHDIAITEMGSNYIRYANGIQICWLNTTVNMAINTAYGSLYQGSYTWTFPVEFVSAPTVTVGAVRWGTGASWGTLSGAPSTTQALLRGIDVTSRASGSTHIEAMAIGYWQ